MRNLDSVPAPLSVSNESTDKKEEVLQPLAAIEAQKMLMMRMLPDSLKEYVVDDGGQTQNSTDDLFLRWHEKYSDTFRDYCDQHMGDNEFLVRIKDESLSEVDMKHIMESIAQAGFEDEVEDIIKFITQARVDENGNEVSDKFFTDDKDIEDFKATPLTH